MTRLIDITGQTFGKLTALQHIRTDKIGAIWRCKCACGKIVEVVGFHLRNGNTKSCGSRECNPRSLPLGEASFNTMYAQYKDGAKKRGYEFKLSRVEFNYIVQQDCAYCGEPPNHPWHAGSLLFNGVYLSNGIDRINNNIGYIPSNCTSCCKVCNKMKYTLTKEEFISHCRKVTNYDGQSSDIP